MSLNSRLGKVLLKFLRVEIGIALIIARYFLGFVGLPLIPRYSFYGLYWKGYFLPGWVAFLLLTVGFFVLYIFDRKAFSDRIKGRILARTFIVILSVWLVIEGIGFGILASSFDWFSDYGTEFYIPKTWEERVHQQLAFAISILGLFSGGLLFFDGLGAPFIFDIWARPLPSKQGISLEEARKKYPKDLFDRYVREYPHNPEGVLEWHINKKMKEGKTREQAIKELMHVLLH